MMIPARLAPVLFGFILSGLMSSLVSAISTVRVLGFSPDLVSVWAGSWVSAWLVAFPAVLVVAPLTRRLVALLVRGQ